MTGQRRQNVGSYTRADGTNVRGHQREVDWQQVRRAWASTAVTVLTAAALVLEVVLMGFNVALLIITALLGLAAVAASKHAGKSQRTMRSAAKSRAQARTRRPTAQRTTRRR